MTRPNKLGIAGCICLILSMAPPYANWKQPVNAALIAIAFALAYRAGRTGSRAWWTVCAVVLLMLSLLLFSAWRTIDLQQ